MINQSTQINGTKFINILRSITFNFMPNISVAIAVYNKQENIISTLKSVLNQNYAAKEIVIVNDGSIDKSESLILSIDDSRIKYIKQENQGAAAARNKAIQNCSYPYIALIDADDIWDPDFLKNIIETIKSYPKQKIFSTALNIEFAQNKHFKSSYNNVNMGAVSIYNYFEASYKSSIIHSSAIVLHKEVFKRVGFFDERILSGQDIDLWIRLGLEFPVVFIPKYLATYRYVSSSLSYSGVSLDDKLQFDKFAQQEKNNTLLKKFLDLNRYSLAVSAKETNDKEWYDQLSKNIDLNNLNSKQRLILKTPGWAIRLMKRFKLILAKIGWQTTSF